MKENRICHHEEKKEVKTDVFFSSSQYDRSSLLKEKGIVLGLIGQRTQNLAQFVNIVCSLRV